MHSLLESLLLSYLLRFYQVLTFVVPWLVQKEAAKEAAREGHDVSLDTDTGAGAGAPVGNQRGNVGNQRSNMTGAGAEAGEYAPGEVIDRKYYTGIENRPQDQALGMTPVPTINFLVPWCLVLLVLGKWLNVTVQCGVAEGLDP